MTVVDRVVEAVCRRARLFGADAEDFAASVKLALVDDDYAILRKFEGRASLATYLSVVVRRLLADERMRARGRWHPSTDAIRAGPAGIVLETLVMRDDHTLDEALPIARNLDSTLTREKAQTILDRLPQRTDRATVVSLDAVGSETIAARDSADASALAAEARKLSERTSGVMRDCLARLTLEDRMILRMRFASAMSIVDISRMLRLPQRPLYRRLEHLLQTLRNALVAAGIDARMIQDLIGASAIGAEMDFGLSAAENAPGWQSIPHQESS